MDLIGSYKIEPYSSDRKNISLIVHEGWLKYHTHSIVEFDVTDARKKIKNINKKTGFKISFTGWIVKCVSQVISENKTFNTFIHKKRKIITFDDVDINIPVERNVNGIIRPLIYIIRKANKKTVKEITNEIRKVQNEETDESSQILGQKLSRIEKFVLNSPPFIKKLALLVMRNNAIQKKIHMGTAGVTAIGMKGNFPGTVIPMGGMATILVVVGGIVKKPGVVKDKILIREYLQLTITTDHELIDGGPLARFVERLKELIENSYELKE